MGTFAVVQDVVDRYVEGDMDPDVTGDDGWIAKRIVDVENELVGLVPSLDVDSPDQLDNTRRAGRVKTLVCDKVLDLYRNPRRAKNITQAMGDINDTMVASNGFNAMIDFTDEELNRVRLRTKRPRFGTAVVSPWKILTRNRLVF